MKVEKQSRPEHAEVYVVFLLCVLTTCDFPRLCRILGPCVGSGMLKRLKGSCRTGLGFTARYQW